MDVAGLTYYHLTAGWPSYLVMSIDSGMIFGVPPNAGTDTVTVVAEDSYGLTCTMTFIIIANPLLPIV